MRPSLIFSIAFIVWASGQLGIQDAVRQEKAHCEEGLELQIPMSEYCDKYKPFEPSAIVSVEQP